MMPRKLWDELKPIWPPLFWDDWLRLAPIRKGRSCIYPEVNRVYTFGKVGSSGGQFFDEYLEKIELNSQPVDWKAYPWESMMEPAYENRFVQTLNAAVVGTVENLDEFVAAGYNDVILVYDQETERSFEDLAKRFGLMSDIREGIPRASYQGVVGFWRNTTRVWLVPALAAAIATTMVA